LFLEIGWGKCEGIGAHGAEQSDQVRSTPADFGPLFRDCMS